MTSENVYVNAVPYVDIISVHGYEAFEVFIIRLTIFLQNLASNIDNSGLRPVF